MFNFLMRILSIFKGGENHAQDSAQSSLITSIQDQILADSQAKSKLESPKTPKTLKTPKSQALPAKNVEDVIDHIKAKTLVGDIIIPSSMTEIHHRLFEDNNEITSVTVPGTVKRIGDRAFADCKNLEKVILNEGIEEIGSNVFTGCEKLRHVTYPDSVKKYQGWTFYGTNLSEPVFNASKTILIFCPDSVSQKEWSVPDSVKIISWQAFIDNKDLEMIHFPEGLEIIERMAFIECGIREITIPHSVREIEAEAFWRCEQLEKVTILNANTKVGAGAFSRCKNLKEINYGNLHESDKIFHLKGLPFLVQHLETPANLNHTNDPDFKRLSARCAHGDSNAMYDFANFFEKWSLKPDASLFYIRASNYWRYRAYCKGHLEAAKWFEKYFADFPDEQLDSILFDINNHNAGYYSHSIPGELLNDLGFDFFDPERDYEIKHFEGENIVEVSAFESYEGPDEDGFGAEYYYDWWFLDENMQPIPGIRCINATLRETNEERFERTRAEAIEIVNDKN